MKRIHYLLLGFGVLLCIAAAAPTLPPTRIIAGSGVTVVTNGMNNFTLSASGGSGVATTNGSATNLAVYSGAAGVPGLMVHDVGGSLRVAIDSSGNLLTTKTNTLTGPLNSSGDNNFSGPNTFTGFLSVRPDKINWPYQRVYYTNFNNWSFYPNTNVGTFTASNPIANFNIVLTNIVLPALPSNAIVSMRMAWRRPSTSGATITYFPLWVGTNNIFVTSVLASGSGGSRGSRALAPGSQFLMSPNGTNLLVSPMPNASSSTWYYPGTVAPSVDFSGTTMWIPTVNVSAPWTFSVAVGKNTAEAEDAPIFMEFFEVYYSYDLP